MCGLCACGAVWKRNAILGAPLVLQSDVGVAIAGLASLPSPDPTLSKWTQPDPRHVLLTHPVLSLEQPV